MTFSHQGSGPEASSAPTSTGRLSTEVSGSLDSCPAMSTPEFEEIRRLGQPARELRRGRCVAPDTERHNERVAAGMRVTGEVIRCVRT